MKTAWMTPRMISCTTLVCLGFAAPSCILVVDDGQESPTREDGTGGEGAAADPGDETLGAADLPADGSGTDEADATGADVPGADTVGDGLECIEQNLADGGFEGGSPNRAWTEASDTFGSPLCDGGCTEEPGAGPAQGEWYAWFGGTDAAERASLTQPFVILGEVATLSLQLEVNAGSGTGLDALRVRIDDEEIFVVTDADIDSYVGYTSVSLDVSDWADGSEHLLSIDAAMLGNGVTSFFVDEVSLAVCSEPTDGSSTSTGAGSETGAGTDSGGPLDGTGSGGESTTDAGMGSTGGATGGA